MKSIKYATIYAFLLWLIPFLASVVIFQLKKTDPAFFQSLLGVTSIIVLVILSVLYFRKIQGNLKEGIFLGLIFLFISWFFDFVFFIWGPIKMPLTSYVKEIGIGYLIYPIITISYGYLLGYKKPASKVL
jgi:EamA domain-containing membrane protein RarD